MQGVRSALGLFALLLTFANVTVAAAHPHVRIVASAEILYAGDGMVTGVRYAWTFDEGYSSYAIEGLDAADKARLSRDDLAPLAKTNVESLKEFKYFTVAKADGRKERFADPVDYYLDYKDAALTLHFTLPLKTPVTSKHLAIEVFDPSYFIEFAFAEKDPVRLIGAPEGCQLDLQRPAKSAPDTASPNEQAFQNGDLSNYGATFVSKISVTCP